VSNTSLAALALTAGLLLVPGLLLSLAAGARLVIAVATAPVVSFGLVTVISRVTTATGVEWHPLTFTIAVLLVAGAVALLRRGLHASRLAARLPWPTGAAPSVPIRKQAVALGAATAAAALGTGTAIWGMGGLTAINQGFDALFHVNAVTLISQTGDADPNAVTAVNHFTGDSTYYPDGFHALAALVAQSGINPVLATNALVAAVPAVLAFGLMGVFWQSGMFRHALVAPFLAVSTTAFPVDLMWRGPIWPFVLGVALVPAVLALIMGAFGQRSRGLAGLAAVGAAGLLLVHPSAALAAGVFAAGFFVQRWVTRETRVLSDVLPLLVVVPVIVVLALPAVITAVTNSDSGAAYDWPAVQNPGQAVGELLLFEYDSPQPQIWLFVSFVIGLVTVRGLRRLAWWPAAAAVFAVLMVMSAAYEGGVVAVLTGPWWNDRYRFAAVAMLGMVVIATHGVVVVAGWMGSAYERIIAAVRARREGVTTEGAPADAGRRTVLVRGGALLAALALFGVLSDGFYSENNHDRMQLQFKLGTGGSVLPGELEAMEEIARLAGPGEVVMNDPSDGSAWMWALHGVRPMFGQAVLTPPSPALEPDQDAVFRRFNCLDSSSEIRRIVDEYDIRYVYVGEGFVIPSMERAQGLRDLANVESLELVFDNGGSQIYRIDEQPLIDEDDDDACQQAVGSSGE
jgi:hypothetical protein